MASANNQSSSIPVSLAFLHQAIVVPGKIGSEKTLSDARIKGIKMNLTPMGLAIEVRGTRAIVPSANVCVAVLEET